MAAGSSKVARESTPYADSTSSSESEDTERPVTSILDVLKAPKVSVQNRKRKVLSNSGHRGKRRCSSSSTSSEPKRVTPEQRIKEFPGEHLVVSRYKLFCKACREELNLKRSTIQNHVRSAKHVDGKEKMAKREAREQDIAVALKAHNASEHLVGEHLPEAQQVFRVKVVSAFLRAAVPISKLHFFKELLEEGGYRLCDKRSLFDLIPFIQKREREAVAREIAGRNISIIFDGTCHLGEALCIVIRYITDDLSIEQRLVALKMLQKSLTGEEIARELISTLSIQYHITPTALLACMRDRAATNNVALRTLKVVYPSIVDIGCLSHTIDHVGEKFETPVLDEFISAWISLFAHSYKNKAIWCEQTGRAMKSYSATRWWSRWEVVEQVLEQFGDLDPFLRHDDIGSPATLSKLKAILSDSGTCGKKVYLQIELASAVDYGKHFVSATYSLEGDGPLVFSCYEVIEKIQAAIHADYTPNVDAVIRNLSSGVQNREIQLRAYSRRCVQPGLDYFNRQLRTNLQDGLAVFKAARIFSPHKVKVMQPTAADVDSLAVIPFLNQQEVLSGLKEELPAYLAKCSDIASPVTEIEWWRMNSASLPKWSAGVRQKPLIQPSSAAAERVFSLLTSSFTEQQIHSLNDYVEASIMLQYNQR